METEADTTLRDDILRLLEEKGPIPALKIAGDLTGNHYSSNAAHALVREVNEVLLELLEEDPPKVVSAPVHYGMTLQAWSVTL